MKEYRCNERATMLHPTTCYRANMWKQKTPGIPWYAQRDAHRKFLSFFHILRTRKWCIFALFHKCVQEQWAGVRKETSLSVSFLAILRYRVAKHPSMPQLVGLLLVGLFPQISHVLYGSFAQRAEIWYLMGLDHLIACRISKSALWLWANLGK